VCLQYIYTVITVIGATVDEDESILTGQRRLLELVALIYHRGRLYQAQLEREGWNRVTMNNILRKLKERELVECEVEFCGRNGTRVWYSLTTKGRKLGEILQKMEDVLEER